MGQRKQDSKQDAVAKKSSPVGAVLGYMYKPRIGKNLAEINRSAGVLPRLLAGIFALQGLFPANHPALRDDSLRLKMTDVIATAYRSLTWDKAGMPKTLFFFAVVASLIFTAIALLGAVMGIFATPAHAGIFDNTLGANDLANRWLDYLFQAGGATNFTVSVPNNAGGGVINQSIGNAVPTAFRALAAAYSTAMLILAALILIYHLISMVVHTAHDGTPMGKSAHAIWAPIRLVFALGLLIPVANGFSSGQWLVLQIAKMGSNLASNVWQNPAIGQQVTGQPNLLEARADLDAEGMIDSLVNIGYCAKTAQLENIGNLSAFLGNTVTAGRTAAAAAVVADFNNAVFWDVSGGSQAAQAAAVAENGRRQPLISGNGASTTAVSKRYYPVAPTNPPANTTYAAVWDSEPCGTVNFPAVVADGSMAPQFVNILTALAQAHVTAFNAIEQPALATGAVYAAAQGPINIGGQCLQTPNSGIAASACNSTSSAGINVAASKQWLRNTYRNTYAAAVNGAGIAGLTANAATGVVSFTHTPNAATVLGNGGWMTAGGWFSTLVGEHQTFGKGASVVPTFTTVCDKKAGDKLCAETQIAEQVKQEQKNTAAANVDANEEDSSAIYDFFMKMVYKTFEQIGLADSASSRFIWHTQFTSASPVSDMIRMGGKLIDGAAMAFAVGLVATVVSSGGIGIITNALGSALGGVGGLAGRAISKVGGAGLVNGIAKRLGPVGRGLSNIVNGDVFKAFAGMVGPLFYGLASIILLPGIILFYALPFLPFINFVTGVITWVISLLQAVVAIPIIAIAHITPHGEGLPSSSARQAYVMVLQIFLRPVMMIFGMLATILIMNTGIGFLNSVFFNIYKQNMAGNASSVFSSVMFMVLYAAAAWGIVKAAVTAIDDFPLKAVSWIGGGQGVDTNHEVSGLAMAAAATVGNQAIQQGIGASRQAIAAPGEARTAAIARQDALAAGQATAGHQQQVRTQLGNINQQLAGNPGSSNPQAANAEAAGNASIIARNGRNGDRGEPMTMTPPGGGGGGGGSSGSGGGTIIQPNSVGGGARSQGQQAYMEAARQGRPMSDLPAAGGNAANAGSAGKSGGSQSGPVNFIRQAAPAAAVAGRSALDLTNGGVGFAGSKALRTQGFQMAVQAAREAGHPKPEIAAAQWALESNWGRSVSGDNNFFGIKDNSGAGKSVMTHEFENGVRVNKHQNFRNFATAQDAFKGHADLIQRRYAGVAQAETLADAAHALVNGRNKYATDPDYAEKLISTMRANGVHVGSTSVAAAPAGIDPGASFETASNAPDQSSGDGGWRSTAHTVLGGLSYIPGVSVVSGLADAALYTSEGRYGDAALAAGSVIPGGKFVTTGGKLAFRGIKMARANQVMDSAMGSSGSAGGAAAYEQPRDVYGELLSAMALKYIVDKGSRRTKPA